MIFSDGLVKGHAYSVTKVMKVKTKTRSEVSLLRVRNPWGNEVEWKGPWSDGSAQWETITEVLKAHGTRRKRISHHINFDMVFSLKRLILQQKLHSFEAIVWPFL